MKKDKFIKAIQKIDGFELRPQQIEMSETIESAIEDDSHAIIEAGTGSGKSFAYLFPLMDISSPDQISVVSTGTIALQEQILEKDIPFLIKSSGKKDFKAVIAKGRNNYICKQKLEEVARTIFPGSPLKFEMDMILDVLDYWDGDFATLPFKISNELKREIESSSDDCIMAKCEYFRANKAPFYNSRKEMAKADLVVTNHSLYMADILSQGKVLPEHHTVVFDEAHHLYNQAINAFTASLGRYSITKLLQKIQKRLSFIPEKITTSFLNLEVELMEWVFSFKKSTFRILDNNSHRLIEISGNILETISELNTWMEKIPVNMDMFPDEEIRSKTVVHKQNLTKQLQNLKKKWTYIYNHEAFADRVNWVECDSKRGYFEIKSAPLNIADTLKEEIWSKKAGIFTSATIAVKDNFDYFKSQIGIEEAKELILPSPFDYKSQSALYIPKDIADPNSKEFIESCRETIINTLNISQGRAFLLFSSWRNMEIAYELFKRDIHFPARKQNDMTRKQTIEWFKKTPNSVLFATSTFWEGIDIPGDSLSCVIIDKLPFSVPDDPVIQARVDYMKENGINWFQEFSLPEAIIKLRQGVGRLIRTKADKGLLVILDNRINTKFYGKTVINSLPPVTRLINLNKASEFIL
ncbi:ATP-dependent DNA helicase [bacterium]|nr:MAG: ATP-dependent DNA helicase [bacterium]